MADGNIRITADTAQAQAAIKGLTDRLSAIEGVVNKSQRSLDSMQRSLSGLSSGFKTLASAVIGASLFNFIDDLQNMQNKLRIASSSQEDFNKNMAFVKAIADNTGQSLSAIGDLYSKVSMSANKLGYDTNQVATVTNAFATALKASGASAQGSASSIYQFSQILAKGKVNGDEFTTIMENLGGPVMDLIAKNMGLTTAELVKLKEKGLIGAKDFTDALIKSMDELNSMTGKTMPTLGQNLQRIQNSFADLVMKFDSATGASKSLADAMSFLAKNVDVVVVAAVTMGTLFVVGRFVAIAQEVLVLARSMGVLAAVMQVIGKSPIMLALSGLIAAATYFGGKKLFGDADQQAADLEKATAAANEKLGDTKGQLTGIADKYKEIVKDLTAQLDISGLNSDEYQVQNQLLQYKKQLENSMTPEQEKQLVSLIRQTEERKRTAKVMEDVAKSQTQATMEQQRLTIQDLNLRAEQEAIDQRRLELKRALTTEEESQVRAVARLVQANKDALAVEQARRALQGTQTQAEAVNRGVGVQQRMDPNAALNTQYQMDQEALQAHLDAKLISEQAYQDQLLLLKQEYANKSNELYIQQIENEKAQRQTQIQAEQMRMGKTSEEARKYAEFEMKTNAEKTQFALDQAGQMFSALGTQNKKAFEAAKAFNIASAIMNTYLSVTKSLAMYPWPFNLIAAGASLAMGLAQVAQIRSQTYSGRQLGGPVLNGQSYVVGENGPEVFTPTTNGSITRNSDINGGSAVNVNFTVNAVDTTGFDDLLVQRRGVITQIISDAMLEKGQRGL